MLNLIWPIFIIISFVYAILFGNVEALNKSIFSSVEEAVNLSISLLGTMCLWSGIMQIARETTFVNKLTIILKPIMELLFPDIPKNSHIYQEISMNIIANFLGLGNAATPLGLKAMKSMQEENLDKEVLTNSMATLIGLNTASIQIIPTTVIAIRSSLGSENPTSIILPVWIATIFAAVAGMLMVKFFIKIGK